MVTFWDGYILGWLHSGLCVGCNGGGVGGRVQLPLLCSNAKRSLLGLQIIEDGR